MTKLFKKLVFLVPYTPLVLTIIVLVWLIISCIDTTNHNLTDNNYANYNVFKMFNDFRN